MKAFALALSAGVAVLADNPTHGGSGEEAPANPLGLAEDGLQAQYTSMGST